MTQLVVRALILSWGKKRHLSVRRMFLQYNLTCSFCWYKFLKSFLNSLIETEGGRESSLLTEVDLSHAAKAQKVNQPITAQDDGPYFNV